MIPELLTALLSELTILAKAPSASFVSSGSYSANAAAQESIAAQKMHATAASRFIFAMGVFTDSLRIETPRQLWF
jgi:hypothetical protein